MTHIILATASELRKKLFRTLGLEFNAQASDVEEYFDGRPEGPEELVQHLAKLKAEAVASKHSTGIIIGFDSVGYFNGEIMEKPKDREEAYERLKRLSGNSHEFYTGIHMINLDNERNLTDKVRTEVWLRSLEDKEITMYLDQDKNFTKYALGYDPIENYSATFIKNLKGSYNNITRGFPVEKMMEMLFDIGYEPTIK